MRPFQKLTPAEITHLQHLISNVLESSHCSSLPPEITVEPQNETIVLLLAELDNNKAVTAQLATMTCSILDEAAICLQEISDLTEELARSRNSNRLASMQICQLRETLQQLANENQQLKLSVQSHRNERDIHIFKYELTVSNHERQKQELIAQLHLLQLQLERVSSSKKLEQQKISSLRLQISDLHHSNSRLHEELITFKSFKAEPNSQQIKSSIKVQDEQCLIRSQQQLDTSIRESMLKLQRSSLKHELMEPLEFGDRWNLQTARHMPEYSQPRLETQRQPCETIQKNRRPTDIEQLSEKDTNRDKSVYQYDNYGEICNQSREDLDQKVNTSMRSHAQLPSKNKNAQNKKTQSNSIIKSQVCSNRLVISKQQKVIQKTGSGFEKKLTKPEGKVSRIKYLLHALGGGDNNIKCEKVQKFGGDRSERTGDGGKQRLALKKVNLGGPQTLSHVTSCTMTPVPSVNLLRKQNQS